MLGGPEVLRVVLNSSSVMFSASSALAGARILEQILMIVAHAQSGSGGDGQILDL